MSTYVADYTTTNLTPIRRVLWCAEIALLVGVAAGIPFALIGLLATLTPNDHHFRHTADYWYTALGIPYLAAPIVLLAALRSLHAGRDGRLGQFGFLATAVSLGAILAMLPYSLAAGTSGGTGPSYPIAAFTADVGMLLYSIGAYRARLLPRPLVLALLIAWMLGGALGPAWGTPLLVAVYAAIAVVLANRFAVSTVVLAPPQPPKADLQVDDERETDHRQRRDEPKWRVLKRSGANALHRRLS